MSKHNLLVGIIIGGLCAVTFMGCSNAKETTTGTVNSSIKLFGNSYSGTYEGKLSNGVPDGKGTLKVESKTISEIQGEWKSGSLEGNCVITYNDGSVESGVMEENRFDGDVTKTLKDGTYSITRYYSGTANGAVEYYDSKGNLIDYDWLYQQVPVKTLCAQVQDIDYARLVYFPNTYIGKMIQVTGTVESVYEAERNVYLTVKDANGKVYICKNKNMKVTSGKQARMQNVAVGDNVKIYGYFLKAALYKYFNQDKAVKFNQYTGTLPHIEVVYGYDTKDGEFNPLNPSYEYADVFKNPYGYDGMKATVTGTVSYVEISNKKSTAQIKLKVDEDFYYVNFKFNKKTDVLPSINDNVTIKGKYYGLYKEEFEKETEKQEKGKSGSSDVEYIYKLYPYVNAKSVTINK